MAAVLTESTWTCLLEMKKQRKDTVRTWNSHLFVLTKKEESFCSTIRNHNIFEVTQWDLEICFPFVLNLDKVIGVSLQLYEYSGLVKGLEG